MHEPVLVNEILENIPLNCGIIYDGTFGHGGHCIEILNYIYSSNNSCSNTKYYGVDIDKAILYKGYYNCSRYTNNLKLYNDNYYNISNIVDKDDKIDLFLIDLGVNKEHFFDEKRGFSIKNKGYLDMRYDVSQDITAKYILNNYRKEDLKLLLENYGDFKSKFAEFIASNIVEKRNKINIEKSENFVGLLKDIGLNQRKIAVVYQVLRICVNKELDNIRFFLNEFPKYISRGGVCMVISYHSIEDRIIKEGFNLLKHKGFQVINKKVITPTFEEIKKNKASSSAKLRIIKYLGG